MKNPYTISDEIIARYLAGESDPEEAMMLHDWLETSENRIRFEEFKQTWNAALNAKRARPVAKERMWKTIKNSIDETRISDNATTLENRTQSRKHFYYRIAAAIAAFVIAGIFAYQKIGEQTTTRLTEISADTIRHLLLPDHSHAVLSQHSKISFNKNFDGGRDVELSGEAFFNVTHNAEKPFIVHTEFADVRVVGTAFNVALKNGKIAVSVAEGRVLVYTPTDSIYLTPGEKITVGTHTAYKIDSSTTANANDWGYATRKFEFKNALLSEVFACIEKSYPYSIKVQNDAIKNCKLTATFDNASAEYIVTLIAETLDLKLTKTGNVFYLEGKGCI